MKRRYGWTKFLTDTTQSGFRRPTAANGGAIGVVQGGGCPVVGPASKCCKPMTVTVENCQIEAGEAGHVSALLTGAPKPQACFVFAHGAGAGMRHAFMEAVADGLAQRRIATLRYQFA